MGEPRRYGRPEGRDAGTGKSPTGIHRGRTGGVPADRVVVAVAAPLVEPENLEALLRRLLPTAPVPLTSPSRYQRTWHCCCSAYCWEYRYRRLHRYLRPGSREWKLATRAAGGSGPGRMGTTDPRSQGLVYDGVFFVWQTGTRGGQVPGIG